MAKQKKGIATTNQVRVAINGSLSNDKAQF